MTKTYSQIVKQIESLQRKAGVARKKEVVGVIGRIKEAIAFYNLNAAELGLGRENTGTKPGAAKGSEKQEGGRTRSAKNTSRSAIKFADSSGNTWAGRGPRPAWLRAAIAKGKTLEDFAIETLPEAGPERKPARKAKPPKRRVAAKYKDGAGNSWSGRGSKPRWMVAALAQGKTLESMAV
jgi:DNA-binding protein H-NS